MHRLAGQLAVAVTAAILFSGCAGSDAGPDSDSGAGNGTTSVAPTQSPGSTGSTGGAAPPAAPTTPEEAVHAIALSAADLPAGWTVEESPTDQDISDDPTFLGLCNFEFLSERRRTAKVPVTGLDPSGNAVLTTEAVSYDEYDAAQLALIELRAAYENCPPDQTFTDIPAADQTGLADDRVVVEYVLAGDTTQTVIVQRRGSLLSVVLGEGRLITVDAARRIFARMSELSPEAAAEV